ncbi:MAG: putative transporter ATP-binding protein [Frankiales bacterium]|nr:putative transporter ATP-binding protein [Frankiales bacterium]
MTVPVLTLRAVSHDFGGDRSVLGRRRPLLCAVDDVTLDVGAGETVAIVGESGSGKSTLGSIAAGLLPPTSGAATVGGFAAGDPRARRIVQVVFQDPFASLNPRRPVGAQIADALVNTREGTAATRRARVAELLASVGLDPSVAGRFPAAFSGGERQRIAIARAIAVRPQLLVCDEPVSSLDVTVRASILELLDGLKTQHGLSILLISHDLAVVEGIADRVGVLYLGSLVELSPTAELFAAARHPYTAALLSAVPRIGQRLQRAVLTGDPPSPVDRPSGCAFHPRCPRAQAVCAADAPPLAPVDGIPVACHFPLARGESLLVTEPA